MAVHVSCTGVPLLNLFSMGRIRRGAVLVSAVMAMRRFQLGKTVSIPLAYLVTLPLGCSDDGLPAETSPALYASATCSWNAAPTSVAGLGRSTHVLIYQTSRGNGGNCAPLPASTRVTVNGEPLGWGYDPETHCLNGAQSVAMAADGQSVTIEVEQDGSVIAEMQADAMAPGTKASLAAPSDGIVHPGGEILVVPPTELPSSYIAIPSFYPLESGTFDVYGQNPPAASTRLADGIHVPVPTFVGRAAFVASGTPPYVPGLVTTCDGFIECNATADNMLGPLYVTEEP